ncbi:MAG: 30S ribosomal protein S15 [Mycoplasmataceae bacterium]|jgi:small subunit ribosomal protein S15|nr:30S ribosomal protein S15 [Mycoplasmataceae bacterium]
MALSSKEKADIIKQFGNSEKDTGKVEVQIALLTTDIKKITEHLKENKKDFSTKRGLSRKTSQRRNLLTYLKDLDIVRYREVIKKLEIRG